MNWKFFAVVLLFFSASAQALDYQSVSEQLEGSYRVLLAPSNEGTYLNCQTGQTVQVHFNDDLIEVAGLTPSSPLSFSDINEGVVGISGPIIGYAQRRTVFREVGVDFYLLKSEHRRCEPLLGKLGCVGKKWRTSVEIKFFLNNSEEQDSVVNLELAYQPFENVTREVCSLEQSPLSLDE